ncbi:hypothetical protein PV05_09911 [Exophiala xenobiotica]|uniref:Uncharacterized protein n=1 Tax=Exophiala xenobiotica TaxID=348802 RepID=A0A0D2E6S1_9EURO|nr:uncharacterized protein PV05_09911 [Exophiala xenobiotica]KIW51163.1 hypothetical protein PV05_09911 [Exophiala xenobiotica]
MSRSSSISIIEAMQKLRDAAKAIELREGVKPHEERRVKEALILLANDTAPQALGARAQSTYLDFLKKVQKVASLSMVVLCVIGLGKSRIGFLREKVRLDLPYEILESIASLDSECLRRLVKELHEKYDHSSLQKHQEIQGRADEDQLPQSQVNVETPGFTSTVKDFATVATTDDQSTDSVTLDLTLLHLIQFFQNHIPSDVKLRMICPLYGIPLPTIQIRSQAPTALDVKVEFGLRSSEALIRHVLMTREPPH